MKDFGISENSLAILKSEGLRRRKVVIEFTVVDPHICLACVFVGVLVDDLEISDAGLREGAEALVLHNAPFVDNGVPDKIVGFYMEPTTEG